MLIAVLQDDECSAFLSMTLYMSSRFGSGIYLVSLLRVYDKRSAFLSMTLYMSSRFGSGIYLVSLLRVLFFSNFRMETSQVESHLFASFFTDKGSSKKSSGRNVMWLVKLVF